MPYDTKTVANSILFKAKEDGVSITPLKLQKLMYYLHGWYLAIQNKPLLNENFEVWQYGPVLPSIYHELKHLGRKSIDDYLTTLSPQDLEPVAYVVNEGDEEFYDILDAVWSNYSGYSGLQLSAMTHKDGSPWDRAKKEYEAVLKNSDIREHFTRQMNE